MQDWLNDDYVDISGHNQVLKTKKQANRESFDMGSINPLTTALNSELA